MHRIFYITALLFVAFAGWSLATLGIVCYVDEQVLAVLRTDWCAQAQWGLALVTVAGMVLTVVGLHLAVDEAHDALRGR